MLNIYGKYKTYKKDCLSESKLEYLLNRYLDIK